MTAVAYELDVDTEESWSREAREAAEATLVRTPRRRWLAERAMDTNTQILDINEDSEPTEDVSLPDVQPMAEYQNEPLRFFVEKLGVPAHTIKWSLNAGYETHTWDGDADPLTKLLDALVASQDVAVESANGTGKSFTCALIILWFLASWKGARVFTFAPKEEQLRAYIWMEIGKLWPRFKILFPTAEMTDLRIQMRGRGDKAWGAQGVSVGKKAGEEVSTKAAGMHAEHLLLVYEETQGIDLAVLEAGENTSTAPHNLRMAVGNPDHQLDALHLFGYDALGVQRPGVTAVRISALDHPNVVLDNAAIVPGAVSVKSVERRRVRYGTDGRLFKSRVRGLSPAEAAEALIRLEWVQKAQRRWADAQTRALLLLVGKGKKSRGVDVANSEDGDEGAVARGQGAVLFEVEAKACPNANLLGYQVHKEMTDEMIEDAHVGVDGVGVGAGAVNELLRNGRHVRSLLGGDKPEGSIDEEKWNNLRSQMYWTMREDLRKEDGPALPPDVELSRDLITPTYKTKDGKIVIESKEEIMKRTPGHRSPNKGDAAVYWNFVRPRDPVKTDLPKRAPSIQERIMAELKALDNPTPAKHYGTVLRQ